MDLDLDSPFRSRIDSSSPRNDFGGPSSLADSFGKLIKGDIGYGGNAFCGSTGSPTTGLLARKLRGLDVQRDEEKEKE